MITDEERREIAERMRGYDVSVFKDSTIVPFLDCLGVGYLDWRGILNSLADLIDRPTCEMTREGEGFRCSACGASHDMSGFEKFPWRTARTAERR